MIGPKFCRIKRFFKNRLGARSTLGSCYFPRVAIFNHILSDLEVLTLIKSELTGWTRASNEVTYTSRGFIYIYHSALKVTKCPLRGSNLCMRAPFKNVNLLSWSFRRGGVGSYQHLCPLIWNRYCLVWKLEFSYGRECLGVDVFALLDR